MSEATEEYRGERILVRFRGERCIHSRRCVLGRPEVFVPNAEGPWIHPEAASAEAVAAMTVQCPSGALSYRRLDGGEAEAPPGTNTVRLWEDGPLAFHAELDIAGERNFRATLCRCGLSKNKPYCDKSHEAAGFRATGEPASKPSEPLAKRDGVLTVTPTKDGPLMVEGALEICAGSGRTIERGEKFWLCRCGASANKPYCDGSHKRMGFTG